MFRVVHLTPGFAQGHPYSLQLARALRSIDIELLSISSRSFLKETLKFRPDVVHIGWLNIFIRPEEDSYALCAARTIKFISQILVIAASGIKIVWTVHELNMPDSRYPALSDFCTRLVAGMCTKAIAHCADAKQKVIAAYFKNAPSKVTTVPHGHFMDITPNSIDRKDARARLSVPKSALVILFFGVIRPYKRILELIEAHNELNREDVFLVIAGTPMHHIKIGIDYFAAVEEAVRSANNVKLIAEFIPDDDIQIYMNASDAVAFPYKSIMTSGALLMAMGFGKPCIVPKLGCMSESVDSNGAFMYDPIDPAGLRNALSACIDARDSLPAMGEHNRRLAEALDWQKIAKSTVAVYQSCVRAKTSAESG
jgi:beta-1,4-mannosyltransferase